MLVLSFAGQKGFIYSVQALSGVMGKVKADESIITKI